MKSYSLTAKGKEFAKKASPTTHSGAVVAAIRKFKKGATCAQIVEEVSKMKLETRMSVQKLVTFMLFDLSRRRGILRSA